MPFLSPLPDLRPVTDDLWELRTPLVYEGKTDRFTAPAGLYTDFASVPWFATWLIGRFGPGITNAAILHDYLVTLGIREGTISARDADGIFRRILREEGVPVVKRWLAWTGVRWGAVGKAHRRTEWLRDAPAVATISLLAAPFVLLGCVPALVAWIAYRATEGVFGLFVKS